MKKLLNMTIAFYALVALLMPVTPNIAFANGGGGEEKDGVWLVSVVDDASNAVSDVTVNASCNDGWSWSGETGGDGKVAINNPPGGEVCRVEVELPDGYDASDPDVYYINGDGGRPYSDAGKIKIGFKLIPAEVPLYACSDNLDNDNDGKVDYPEDPGCESAEDDDEYNEPEPAYITLDTTKIVCEDEKYLPNWGGSLTPILESTANDFLDSVNADGKHCRVDASHQFQWAPGSASNPGDNSGEAGDPWTTFVGSTQIDLEELGDDEFIWVREVWSDDNVPFTGVNTTEDVSAEMYCHIDSINYDNYDEIVGLEEGETYHCLAFNAPVEPEEPVYQCSDGKDNDHDGLSDEEDPGCWTDPKDPQTYDPKDDDEYNEIEEDHITLVSTKIVCDDESLLPNWAAELTPIDENTVSEFLASVNTDGVRCEVVSDYQFQWAPGSASNPGDHLGEVGDPWTTFVGSTQIALSDLGESTGLWVREVWNEVFIPFTGVNTTEDVSAEMYCHVDTINYDNYDEVTGIEDGQTYYCVAFNVYAEDPEPQNLPPVADAGPNQTVYVGDEVTLDGTASYDTDGTIVSYDWTSSCGNPTAGATTTVTSSATTSCEYMLEVTDNDGATSTATTSVTWIERPEEPVYQCSDDIDNDGDGKVDYPDDPGCSGPEDNDEYNSTSSGGGSSSRSSRSSGTRVVPAEVVETPAVVCTEADRPVAPVVNWGPGVIGDYKAWFAWNPQVNTDLLVFVERIHGTTAVTRVHVFDYYRFMVEISDLPHKYTDFNVYAWNSECQLLSPFTLVEDDN